MTESVYSQLIYLIIIGGIAAFAGIVSIKNLLELIALESGNACTGRIARKRIDTDDGKFYYVTYKFKDGRGNDHEREIQIRKAAYGNLREGQSVAIVYQEGNPRNSYLREPGFRASHYLRTGGFLAFSIFLFYIAYNFVHYCIILSRCGS